MGFNWHACVSTGYAQQVVHNNCYSRFATRCLKLANPVVRTKTKKQKTRTKLPGEDLPDPAIADRTFYECPFSDTEEELEAMRPEHRKLYEKIKKGMYGYHDSEELIIGNRSEKYVTEAFQAAVEHLLPGQGNDFAIKVEEFGGAHGEVNVNASDVLAYLIYLPTYTDTGAAMDAPRGEIDIPWGYMMTPIRTLDAETSKQVDAAFAVLVDRLGLHTIGAPGLKLITTSSGG